MRNGEMAGRLLFGLIVLGIGVLFMLDRMGIASAGDVFQWWPVLLLLLGLARLSGMFGRRRVTSGLIFTLIGGVSLLRNLGLIDLDVWDFWPLILVIAGAVMVGGALRRHPLEAAGSTGGAVGSGSGVGESGPSGSAGYVDPSTRTGSNPEASTSWRHGGRSTVRDASSRITGFSLFSSIERRVTSQSFRGGDVSAIMGGHEIDLRGARIDGESAVIDVFVIMGGVDITVPEGWVVSNEIVPIMGGIEDRARVAGGAPSGHLILRGVVLMGGVEIKN
jgi:hypothetical protein